MFRFTKYFLCSLPESSPRHKALVVVTELSDTQISNKEGKNSRSSSPHKSPKKDGIGGSATISPAHKQGNEEVDKEIIGTQSSPEICQAPTTCFSSPKKHRKYFGSKTNSPKSSPEHSHSGSGKEDKKDERKSFLRSPFSRRKFKKSDSSSSEISPTHKGKNKDVPNQKNKGKELSVQKIKQKDLSSITKTEKDSPNNKRKDLSSQKAKGNGKIINLKEKESITQKNKGAKECGGSGNLLQNRRKGSTSSTGSTASSSSGLYSPRQLRKTRGASYQDIDSLAVQGSHFISKTTKQDNKQLGNSGSRIPSFLHGKGGKRAVDSASDTSESEKSFSRITKPYTYRSQEDLQHNRNRRDKRNDTVSNLKSLPNRRSSLHKKGPGSDGSRSGGEESRSSSLTSLSRLPISRRSVESPPRSPGYINPPSPRSFDSPIKSPGSKSPVKSPSSAKTQKPQPRPIVNKSLKRPYADQTDSCDTKTSSNTIHNKDYKAPNVTLKYKYLVKPEEEVKSRTLPTTQSPRKDYASIDICNDSIWEKRSYFKPPPIPTSKPTSTLPHYRNGLAKLKKPVVSISLH